MVSQKSGSPTPLDMLEIDKMQTCLLSVAKERCQHLPVLSISLHWNYLTREGFSSFISNAMIHLLLCVHIFFAPEPSTLSTTAEPLS